MPATLATRPEAQTVLRRAEFWGNQTATLLEVINVVGRFESVDEFKVRTQFTVVENARIEDETQSETQNRYEMAQRMGCVERVALKQNVPNLPFTNERLAASLGMTCDDFNALPVTTAAANVVFDALVESKSSLLQYALADKRRAAWINDDGSFNEAAFRIGQSKARGVVIFSWFLFGKGNFVWVLLAVQFLHDARPDLFPWTPKDLNLDKIGAII